MVRSVYNLSFSGLIYVILLGILLLLLSMKALLVSKLELEIFNFIYLF